VAARGCLPPGANVFVAGPTPAIRSQIDILMVTTMALVSRDCEQYAKLGVIT